MLRRMMDEKLWAEEYSCFDEYLDKELRIDYSMENLKQSVRAIIQEVSEDICDNYCKYRETADEDCLCDAIRNGNPCPLDKLN